MVRPSAQSTPRAPELPPTPCVTTIENSTTPEVFGSSAARIAQLCATTLRAVGNGDAGGVQRHRRSPTR